MDIEKRFMSYVTIVGECWLWEGYRDRDGYGKFFTKKVNGRAIKVFAHRWSYQHFIGPIPIGYHVDHLCINRWCVNYDHLEAVTPKENNSRSNSLSAQRASQTHCLRGHEFTLANTHTTTKNQRRCKICWRIYAANARSKKCFLVEP